MKVQINQDAIMKHLENKNNIFENNVFKEIEELDPISKDQLEKNQIKTSPSFLFENILIKSFSKLKKKKYSNDLLEKNIREKIRLF